MLYTEDMVRQNLRNREGKRVFYLAKGDTLTPGARDWLSRERVEILPAEMAKPDCYRLLSGALLTEKPEHMTHLNGNVLVLKTHPRIRFRGKMDTLEGELLWCALQSDGQLRKDLEEILNLARLLIRCDVLEEPVPDRKLDGMDQQELRSRSHLPQKYYGQPHFMPEGKDSLLLLQINLARTAARQAELAATHAFCDRDGNPTRPDILQALNRLSSYLYILMIELKAKQ